MYFISKLFRTSFIVKRLRPSLTGIECGFNCNRNKWAFLLKYCCSCVIVR